MNKIKNYISALESVIKPRDIKGSSIELRDFLDLYEQDYISSPVTPSNKDDGSGFIYQASITPKGALALAQWKDYISEKSILGKLQKNLGILFWLVIGAALPVLIKSLNTLI